LPFVKRTSGGGRRFTDTGMSWLQPVEVSGRAAKATGVPFLFPEIGAVLTPTEPNSWRIARSLFPDFSFEPFGHCLI